MQSDPIAAIAICCSVDSKTIRARRWVTGSGRSCPAEGHLLRLAEPHEVEASWKSWASVLL